MTWIRVAVTRVSPRTEFAVVCLLAFGWFSASSVVRFLSMTLLAPAHPPLQRPVINEHGLIGLMIYESVVILALSWVLGVRGWTPARIGLQPNWGSSGMGIVLAALAYLAVALVSVAVVVNSTAIAAMVGRTHLVAGGMGLGVIAASSVVNALFEELFVSGYLISVLKRTRGIWFAANFSAGVRLLYHLYQGPLAVISILPVGLLFGHWYARTGRLWPLIVAHALMDVLALLAYQ